ncbi:MAG: polyprenyl synthetase family protein [Eubacteriales bacterium]|nr:polyprenyl synthetase family protein [Eubacteriales bacterium]
MTTHAEFVRDIENKLRTVFYGNSGIQAESMSYSLLAGGKRLRPVMLLEAVEMLGGSIEEAMIPACAVEMIHTYSLIHDDLPGMDDDTLRRGVPTNHVVYGVGQAILAGDGLLTHAFQILAENALNYPEHAVRHIWAIREIASAAGVNGMIQGQSLDLLCEREGGGANELELIHLGKTAAMFRGALRAGGRLAGANDGELYALTEFARNYGLLFQYADDIMDVVSSAEKMGKSIGKDEKSGKLTAVSLYGLDGAKERCRTLYTDAIDALRAFEGRSEYFHQIAQDCVEKIDM